MFLGWKNPYSENGYTTQSNLQIQGNSYQMTRDSFHRTRTKNYTGFLEIQNISNNQSDHEKVNHGTRETRIPDFRLY